MDHDDKLPVIVQLLKDNPDVSKRYVQNMFRVTQHVIARWEKAGLVKFRKPKVNVKFTGRSKCQVHQITKGTTSKNAAQH